MEIVRMNTTVLSKHNKKELTKAEKLFKERKKEAIVSLKKSNAFILVSLEEKGFKSLVNGKLTPSQSVQAIEIIERISLEFMDSLKDIPCNCEKCSPKLSEVN